MAQGKLIDRGTVIKNFIILLSFSIIVHFNIFNFHLLPFSLVSWFLGDQTCQKEN